LYQAVLDRLAQRQETAMLPQRRNGAVPNGPADGICVFRATGEGDHRHIR
jgi:hypothetical protein